MKFSKILALIIILIFVAYLIGPTDTDNNESNNQYPPNGLYSASMAEVIVNSTELGSNWISSSNNVSSTEPNWTDAASMTYMKTYQPGHTTIIYLNMLKYDTVENASQVYSNITEGYAAFANSRSYNVGNASLSLEISGLTYQYHLFFQSGNVVMKMTGLSTGWDAIFGMNEDDFIRIAKDQFSKLANSVN